MTTIRLTSLSHAAGCGCKLGSADLTEVLKHLPLIDDANVLVDAATRDDAAVYRLSADRALVATVDFFTPIVDDPEDWGAIATANALSDVYAMGGRPLFALNLVGWPRGKLPFEILGEVLRGAARIARQAGCLMLGGHSIDDPEPKFGLAVVGEVHPDRMLTNATARPGDFLVLTKPLGTGILTTALKRNLLPESDLAPAVASMTALNDGAARAAAQAGVTCATDVTGFGLLGHLGNILAASEVGARIEVARLPVLPRALELAAAGAVPGGTQRNHEAARAAWSAELSPAERFLCTDAQTSGGLLLAVGPDRLDTLLAALAAEGTPAAAVIGEILPAGRGLSVVRGAAEQ
ncbi:MAG TPA: selenide, water dikinase SelD [Gemmatimonadales bacterium]|nr:selenide, water dikinase SelD [Gemmatimonadales bacterium]